MAQCEAAKKGQNNNSCVPRAAENTGSGSRAPAPK